MKKEIKKRGQGYLKTGLLMLLLTVVFASVTASSVVPQSTCPEPSVSISGQGSSSVSFSWSAVSGATSYQVWYVRQEDSYSSAVTETAGTSIHFSGLAAGTYDFYFVSICDAGTSGYVIVDDLVMI